MSSRSPDLLDLSLLPAVRTGEVTVSVIAGGASTGSCSGWLLPSFSLESVEVPPLPWLSVLSCPRLDPFPRMSWTQRSLLHRLVPQMGRSY